MPRRILPMALALILILHAVPSRAGDRLRLATTTSTDNSGLLLRLNRPFEEQYDLKVDVIAVGTGKAIALGRNGDADVVLVHARGAEDTFIDEGHGVNRRDVMYNDFVVLGPPADPAKVAGGRDAAAALKQIAAAEALFISRGDDSGTHKRERKLWQAAGTEPSGSWYLEIGQGMGAAIIMAGEKEAYVLADRGTYLALREKTGLQILVEGDEVLTNPYGIMAVNPARWQDVNYVDAMTYIGWLTSPEGQKIIRDFTIGGEPLFKPMAVP